MHKFVDNLANKQRCLGFCDFKYENQEGMFFDVDALDDVPQKIEIQKEWEEK